MPVKACANPRCGGKTSNGAYCLACFKGRQRTRDEVRGSSSQRGYDAHWQKAREIYLADHPYCVECEKGNRVEAATVVDHIIPHRGDQELFWDSEGNWQALCKRCHDRKTARGQ